MGFFSKKKIQHSISSRAVGYCYNQDCDNYSKGIFLLNHGNKYYCPHCRMLGEIVEETAEVTDIDNPIFTEVRVNFNYDPIKKKYRETVIIRDESEDLWGMTNVYELSSPLIKTDMRASKVAETILANLDYTDLGKDMSVGTHEFVLDISSEEYKTDLKALESRLSRSHKGNLRNAGKKEIIR